MTGVDDHNNQHRPFPSSQRGDPYGPTTTQPLPPPPHPSPMTNDKYYDVAASGIHVVSGGSTSLLQPFLSSTAASSYTAFKSAGGGMAASVGFPFTNAQWKELERQAMIYKYMVASVPVPLDLLLNLSASSSANSSLSPLGGEFKLRFSNGTDPEPGRCKRTDGKKWRCSRDVAPDQKYCERHMHRGRPRSRKHVELHVNNNNNNINNTNNNINKRARIDHLQHHNNNNNSNNNNVSATTLASSNSSQTHFLGGTTLLPYHPSPVFEHLPSHHLSADKEPRSLDWMMKGGEHVPMTGSDPRWLHLMQQTKLEMTSKPSSPLFTQEEPFLNLNSYANFTTTTAAAGGGEDQHVDRECALFLNPDDVVSLQNPTSSDPPRSFIDAWSQTQEEPDHQPMPMVGVAHKISGKLSPSSLLTLSMGGQSQTPSSCCWLTAPGSWVGSSLGGPLAEVLRPSAPSDPPSPFTGNGDSGSPPATVVSSPSGVLQKTLAASLSDSSGCSSPALGSSKSKPEISLL